MRKTFFTGRSKARKLPKAASDENLNYSTNPRDLPDGILVGSMTVPYMPPDLRDAEEESAAVSPKKGKKSKGQKTAKDHKGSPLVSHHIIAAVAASTSRFDSSNQSQELSKCMRISSSPLKIKQENWAQKERLQRSCSLDALNVIESPVVGAQTGHDGNGGGGGGDDDGGDTPEVRIRRCSTETGAEPSFVPPSYKRGRSYNVETTGTNSRINRHSYHVHRPEKMLQEHKDASKSSPTSYHREISTKMSPQNAIHMPKSVEHLIEILQSPEVNVNLVDELTGDAPIHSIIKRKKKERVELLLALLMNSNVDIDFQNGRHMTALHMAIEVGCEMCVKATIVFGADINKQGPNHFTPLEFADKTGKSSSIKKLLQQLGATAKESKKKEVSKPPERPKKIPRLFSLSQKMKPPKREERLKHNDNLSEFINVRGIKKLYNELEVNVMRRLSISATIGGADDAFALVLQQRELALYNRTLPKPKKNIGTAFGLRGGSRILFLDGGGIKGLVQLEVLIQLEERTQCKIPDLFDWIVGTSTGGVIALALVYGKKSLGDLRQLYFLLKNRIFMKSRYGYGYSSDVLEEILKDYLKPSMKMSDVTHPKVLIAAVNKATTNLELHFFNNCLNNEYSDELVWKVARYTSAAPMFFNESDNYVDGGVICNNPTDCGLTAIQNYCRLTDNNIPIAVVVSVGTGVYPSIKIGSVDAQNALFFGKQWLKPGKLIKQTQNLLSLLSNALVESELVAENSRSRCKEQEIPFFRFSPKFEELIAAGETDNEKLFNMIIKTKLYLKELEKEMDELVNIFHAVAESSKDLSKEAILEEEAQPNRNLQNGVDPGETEMKKGVEPGYVPSKNEETEMWKGVEPAKRDEEGPNTPHEVVKEESNAIQEVRDRDEEEDPHLKGEPHLKEEEPHLKEEEPCLKEEDPHLKGEEPDSGEEESIPRVEIREPEKQAQEGFGEEDDDFAQLTESIKEEDTSSRHLEQFTGNFLFNSINKALQLCMLSPSSASPESDLKSSFTEHPIDASSDLTEHPIATEEHHQERGQHHHQEPGQHQQESVTLRHSANTNQALQSRDSAQNLYKPGTDTNQALQSRDSAQNLYKPYRTDTRQVDESCEEYTEYKRETLV